MQAVTKPLVYSCSGCSSAAQMANDLALKLHSRGLAEMSCIAGVGGGVPALVRVAQSGRPILALDGCPLDCVKSCLQTRDVEPTVHHVLSQYGVKKLSDTQYDPEQAEQVLETILSSFSTLDPPSTTQ